MCAGKIGASVATAQKASNFFGCSIQVRDTLAIGSSQRDHAAVAQFLTSTFPKRTVNDWSMLNRSRDIVLQAMSYRVPCTARRHNDLHRSILSTGSSHQYLFAAYRLVNRKPRPLDHRGVVNERSTREWPLKFQTPDHSLIAGLGVVPNSVVTRDGDLTPGC